MSELRTQEHVLDSNKDPADALRMMKERVMRDSEPRIDADDAYEPTGSDEEFNADVAKAEAENRQMDELEDTELDSESDERAHGSRNQYSNHLAAAKHHRSHLPQRYREPSSFVELDGKQTEAMTQEKQDAKSEFPSWVPFQGLADWMARGVPSFIQTQPAQSAKPRKDEELDMKDVPFSQMASWIGGLPTSFLQTGSAESRNGFSLPEDPDKAKEVIQNMADHYEQKDKEYDEDFAKKELEMKRSLSSLDDYLRREEDEVHFRPNLPTSSFLQTGSGSPDSFADLDAKLKQLEEKTKAELAKLQADTAAPSSFMEEGSPDSFADLDAKLKQLEEKTKAELAKLQADTAAPSSLLQEGSPDSFADLDAKL